MKNEEQKNILYVYYDESKVKKPSFAYESNAFDIHFPEEFYTLLSLSGGPRRGVMYSIPLGIRTFVDPKFKTPILILPRSSASSVGTPIDIPELTNSTGLEAFKVSSVYQIKLANTVGLVDWDYRGDWQARIMFEGGELVTTPSNLSVVDTFGRLLASVARLFKFNALEKIANSFMRNSLLHKNRLSVDLEQKPYIQALTVGFDEIRFINDLAEVPKEFLETSRGAGGFGSSDNK